MLQRANHNRCFLNSAQALDIDVDIQTMNISKTVTRADNGERGPALAILRKLKLRPSTRNVKTDFLNIFLCSFIKGLFSR